MSLRTRKDQASGDAQAVARVRGALEGYLASHGPDVSVSVRHVLDLLDPDGMWSHDPEYGRAAQQAGTGPPPADADPLTGCKPVTPEPG